LVYAVEFLFFFLVMRHPPRRPTSGHSQTIDL
jgi:hypothetical protein